jgi:hypothetical protein
MAVESKTTGKIKTQIIKGSGSKGQRGIRMREGCGFSIYWPNKYREMSDND